jgi:hypothetical protein
VLPDQGNSQPSKRLLARMNKTRIFTSGENARLSELITLLGCRSEIAVFDVDEVGWRTGEMIARAGRCLAQKSGRHIDEPAA